MNAADAGAPVTPILRIGITTRSLFALEEEHAVFQGEGVEAYTTLQREREDDPLNKGPGYDVIRRLLALNEGAAQPLVDVILLSKNSPDLSLRAMKAIRRFGLPLKTCSFTSGRSVAPFIAAWGIDLFLSNDLADVAAALSAGGAAGRLGAGPVIPVDDRASEVRIALDGDSVIFDSESDEVFRRKGLKAFLRHESDNVTSPMNKGPFGDLLTKLAAVRAGCRDQGGPGRLRIAVVTSRSTAAHARVILTLRTWDTAVDEVHFVGDYEKAPLLAAIGAHIFFDDREKHIAGAARVVCAAHVPNGSLAGEALRRGSPRAQRVAFERGRHEAGASDDDDSPKERKLTKTKG